MNNPNFLSIGMDVSDTTAHVCVMDRTGILREFTVSLDENSLRTMIPLVGPDEGVVIIETGGRAAWIKRVLEEDGRRVIVADARKLKAISGQTVKTDRKDTRVLAELGLVNEFMPSRKILHDTWVRPPEHQRIYDQLMMRDQLVRRRGDLVREIRSIVKMRGGKLPSTAGHAFHRLFPTLAADIQALTLPVFTVIAAMSKSIDDLEASLEKQAKTMPDVERMLQIPGVGVVTCMAFFAVVGDPKRFANVRNIGAYLGLTVRVDQSGRSNPALGISKCGNGFVRRLLVNCAAYILGPKNKTDSALRAWGLNHVEAHGAKSKKKARCATARKLAVMLLSLWKNEATWQAFPGSASESETPPATFGCDDCVLPPVEKHDQTKIAASPTDPIQPCAHVGDDARTDESAESREGSRPEATTDGPRQVAKMPNGVPKAPRPKVKVQRSAPPKIHPGSTVNLGRDAEPRPKLGTLATSRGRVATSRASSRGSEDDPLGPPRSPCP